MTVLDWAVAAVYLCVMLAVAMHASLTQSTAKDYFLAGNRLGPISLATSTIATQSSTNSLLGIPAFVGFTAGGGLIWLQYEIAVPLAMLATIVVLRPAHGRGLISVYGLLEERLGRRCRLLASAVFLLFRAIATGVTVYGVALVLTLILPVSYTTAVFALMCVTIVYDIVGGMRAVVISDVVQIVLIGTAVAAALILLADEVGGFGAFFAARTEAFVFDSGFSGASDYGLLPMVIGGFFLYLAYYGCDQSQAQRVLSARNDRELQRVLLYAGTLRFPLVFAYCLLGLGLAAYAHTAPAFTAGLPLQDDGTPNVNLAFPMFVLQHFPPGFVGLVIVGIFAAAMSSIDSAINSLSAVTVADFLAARRPANDRGRLWLSKAATLFWGAFIVGFSFLVDDIAPTVLEAINKIGSMANGPLLALFLNALLRPRYGERAAIVGFGGGLAANACTAAWFANVSWLWWNVIGLVAAIVVARFVAGADGEGTGGREVKLALRPPDRGICIMLVAMTCLIVGVCIVLTAAA